MSTLLNLNVCLTDIPKEKIFTSEKTGKKYISLTVQEKREVDQYGKTHSLSISQTKEEREAKAPKVFVGDGKAYAFGSDNQQPQQTAVPTSPAEKAKVAKKEESDDLPF